MCTVSQTLVCTDSNELLCTGTDMFVYRFGNALCTGRLVWCTGRSVRVCCKTATRGAPGKGASSAGRRGVRKPAWPALSATPSHRTLTCATGPLALRGARVVKSVRDRAHRRGDGANVKRRHGRRAGGPRGPTGKFQIRTQIVFVYRDVCFCTNRAYDI